MITIHGMSQVATERAGMRERLRQSESLLAEAQAIAHLGSWNWDIPSNTLTWSDEHYRLFGMRPEDGPLTYEQGIGVVHPDDRAATERLVAQSLLDGRPFEVCLRGIHRDGSVRIMHSRGQVVFDKHGQPIRMAGTIQDITERRRDEDALLQSRGRFQAIFENSLDGILLLDDIGRCVDGNSAICQLLGYTRNELLGLCATDITPNREQTSADKKQFRVAGAVSGESTLLCRDGTTRQVEYRAATNILPGLHLAAYRDITDRKRLEKEILEVSERERRAIGQDLHDDLCQQLTGISFTTRLLQQRLLPRAPAESKVAEEIVQAVQKATERARDLAKGLHPVRLEASGIVAALRELAATVESVFKIRCRLRLRPGTRSPVCAAPVAIQLYRIAQESATNAIKHGKARNISIRLTVVKGRLRLTIMDDGVGIAESPATQGIGLPIMHRRAQAIGATLAIARRKRGGTIVSCIMPAKS